MEVSRFPKQIRVRAGRNDIGVQNQQYFGFRLAACGQLEQLLLEPSGNRAEFGFRKAQFWLKRFVGQDMEVKLREWSQRVADRGHVLFRANDDEPGGDFVVVEFY